MKAAKSMPPHYYMAIRKAIFKQKAFLKGFLLPLCEEGDCAGAAVWAAEASGGAA